MIVDTDRPITISEELDVVDLLGISDILLDNKKVSFRARGWCMHPASRNRDILEFTSVDIRQIEIGDGCLFHNRARLYCHKVTQKYPAYIITQQDGPQNPIYSYQIIGKLVSVKRNGKTYPYDSNFDLDASRENRFNLYYHADIFVRKNRKILVNFIKKLQGLRFYMLVAKAIFREKHYLLGTVSKQQPFYKPLNYLEISKQRSDEIQSFIKDSEEISAFHILAKIGDKAAGRLAIANYYRPEFPQAQWWLSQISVRIRYGGLGIETELMNEVLRIAKILRINKLFSTVGKNNSSFISLLRKNGFKVISSEDNKNEIVLALDLDSIKNE